MSARRLRIFIVFCLVTAGVLVAFPKTSHGFSRRARGDLGFGLMLGEPYGATVKAWDDRMNALQLGIAYSNDNYFNFLGDYLWHVDSRQLPEFAPYIGVGLVAQAINANGARLRSHQTDLDFAGRVPLGIEWQAPRARLGVFGELAPALSVSPAWFLFVQAEAGLRIYL